MASSGQPSSESTFPRLEQGKDVVGFEPQRRFQAGARQREVALLLEDDAEIGIRVGVFRPEAEGQAERVGRLIQPSQAAEGHALIAVVRRLDRGGVRANHRLCDIGKADVTARFMRQWCAANRPTTTTLHHGRPPGCGERTWLRRPSKESIVDRVARGETAGDLSKTCHLLPSAAI
jgi:hypothetical protein